MSGVTLDDLCAADIQQRCDFVEVFAVVMHRDFHPTVFALTALAEVLASDAVDQRLTLDGAGAELDQ
ncbi:host specificity protein [Pseudomonas syringae pv. spinaceae]|uniref:Host specificity protein n=2 Tax=Pseudomonas syringae TaxID=317 RepID=A0A0N8T9Q8_PSESX|nr:host specificity protein [Pseudomonas syringae pv. spinaceae]